MSSTFKKSYFIVLLVEHCEYNNCIIIVYCTIMYYLFVVDIEVKNCHLLFLSYMDLAVARSTQKVTSSTWSLTSKKYNLELWTPNFVKVAWWHSFGNIKKNWDISDLL